MPGHLMVQPQVGHGQRRAAAPTATLLLQPMLASAMPASKSNVIRTDKGRFSRADYQPCAPLGYVL